MIGQTRIETTPGQLKFIHTTIWQEETDLAPWAVQVEGWENNLDLTIYHESIGASGSAHYYGLSFDNALKFVQFVEGQLKTWIALGRTSIEVSGKDLRALYDGYSEGVRNAQQVFINEKVS